MHSVSEWFRCAATGPARRPFGMCAGLLLAAWFFAGLEAKSYPILLGEPVVRSDSELLDLKKEPAQVFLKPLKINPDPEVEAPRWRDIAGGTYSRTVRDTFSYREARVRITYARIGGTFQGYLEAYGLKPNFAYQVKLRGDYARSPKVHRLIGYLGRWRLPGGRTNYSDRQYREAKDPSRVESYILFDFFVTDKHGRARKSLYLNSTLHVLWNDLLNHPWRHRQTLSRVYRVEQDTRDYAQAFVPPSEPTLVEIWAESQRGRAPVGGLRLPEGRYPCQVVLTEESFHQTKDELDGKWATVLGGEVEFLVWRRRLPADPKAVPEAGEAGDTGTAATTSGTAGTAGATTP